MGFCMVPADLNFQPLIERVTHPQGYLENNTSHFRPISAHFSNGIRYAATSLNQAASPVLWHGHLLRGISKGIVITGYILNSLIAAIETVAALAIAIVGTLLNVACRGQIKFIEKYTIKSFAYALNSGMVLGAQIYCLAKKKFPNSHTVNALLNQGMYLSSAIVCNLVFGGVFDYVARRNHNGEPIPYPLLRALWVLREGATGALRNIMNGLGRDFGNHQQLREVSQEFLQTFPHADQHYNTLRQLSFDRLNDPIYRNQLRNLVQDFLVHSRIGVRPEGQVNVVEPNVVILNAVQEQDSQYQTDLQACIKNTFKKIYNTDELARCFAEEQGKAEEEKEKAEEEIKEGREALLGFYSHIYVPIAHLAQLTELEAPEIVCPEAFGNLELHQYNDRRGKLEAARKKLNELKGNEKTLLVQKLLKGSSVQAAGAVQELYLDITGLAGSLHQGKLMSQMTLDLQNFNSASNNLFQKAVQDAVQEIMAAG